MVTNLENLVHRRGSNLIIQLIVDFPVHCHDLWRQTGFSKFVAMNQGKIQIPRYHGIQRKCEVRSHNPRKNYLLTKQNNLKLNLSAKSEKFHHTVNQN